MASVKIVTIGYSGVVHGEFCLVEFGCGVFFHVVLQVQVGGSIVSIFFGYVYGLPGLVVVSWYAGYHLSFGAIVPWCTFKGSWLFEGLGCIVFIFHGVIPGGQVLRFWVCQRGFSTAIVYRVTVFAVVVLDVFTIVNGVVTFSRGAFIVHVHTGFFGVGFYGVDIYAIVCGWQFAVFIGGLAFTGPFFGLLYFNLDGFFREFISEQAFFKCAVCGTVRLYRCIKRL